MMRFEARSACTIAAAQVLNPTTFEVRVDPATGLLKDTHAVSVFDRPDNLDRFGGAYQITNVPAELKVIQRGRDPGHFEIVPAQPMTFAENETSLGKIVLVPN
jgi:hypothetical protein